MRKPTVAPKLDQLLKSQKFDLLEIIKKAPGALFEGRYLHWDELQYREPPGGLSREEYWFLTKLKRQASRQMVPLVDKNGEPFNYISVDPIPQRLHEIDLRLGGQVKMPEQVTNRETRHEYYVNSLIQEAITSSQLEGATTTRQAAKEMLRTGRAPRDRRQRPISHIVLKAPAKYGYAFLFTETDEGDLTYFILYHLKIITRALESLHEYIARKAAELERLELELRGIESLNHRQRSLIQHAARHP